jgi:hypothetical protein
VNLEIMRERPARQSGSNQNGEESEEEKDRRETKMDDPPRIQY